MQAAGDATAIAKDRVHVVGTLGLASDEARKALEALPAPVAALARSLAEDAGARRKVPAFVEALGASGRRMEDALALVWPRSSPSRPKSASAAFHVCTGLSGLIGSPRADIARRLARLDEAPRHRIASECTHVIDLETRLAEQGADLRSDIPSPLRAAAEAMDRISAAHGIRTLEDAESLETNLADALSRLDDAAGSALSLCRAVGMTSPTLGQAVSVAQTLRRLPVPWSDLADGTHDLALLTRGIAERGEALAGVEAAARHLDDRFGPTWRGEEPAKLGAAAVILSDPLDPRTGSAKAYAETLGHRDGEDAAKVLRAMAKTVHGLRNLPGRPPDAVVLGDAFDLGTSQGCSLAVAYLEGVAEWVRTTEASEVMRRVRSGVFTLPVADRSRALKDAALADARLGALVGTEGRTPLPGLRDKVSEKLLGLRQAVAEARAHDTATLQRSRRAAHTLRERRLALQRILSDESFPALGATDAETVVAAFEWEASIGRELPQGLDPSSPYVTGTIKNAVEDAAREAQAVLEAERGLQAIGKGLPPEEILAAAEASDRLVALAEARAEVDRHGFWDDVAWLEEEGIEPGLWGVALPERTSKAVASPPPRDGRDVTAREPADDPSTPSVREFDFSDPGNWVTRTVDL